MSEEVAASIGDVLAENERLKQQLAQAMELLSATPETMAGQTLPEAVATVLRAMRAAQQLHLQALDKLKQAEAELAQVKDTATMAAVAYGMNEALNDAEANNKALRIAIRRLTEANDGLMAVNRQINIFALQQVERAMLLERAARRLVVAWRAERKALRAVNEAWLRDGKAIEGLRAALQGLLDEPYGCPLCDCGRTRNPAKGHMDDCPYEIARALLNESEA